MILIVSINFISFYAGSISCFKTIHPVSIMLFFFLAFMGSDNLSRYHQGTLWHKVRFSNRGCRETTDNIAAGIFILS